MIEFLIQHIDGNWFDFPPGSNPYRPLSIPFQRVADRQVARIEIDGCQISFAYEDSGVQASFEGPIAQQRAIAIAEEIRQRIEQISGQRAEAIQISG